MFEYKERYCEWKDGEPLDQNEKIVTKWKLKTDCGQDLIVTPHNRWGILRRKEGTINKYNIKRWRISHSRRRKRRNKRK